MKAWALGAQTGLGSLHLVDREQPQPGPGEALVKVRLACLNNRDIQILEGRYGAKKAADRVPFSEGVGEVVALGDGDGLATAIARGDRVVCPHFVGWDDNPFDIRYFGQDLGTSLDGWGAEYICLPVAALVKVPDDLADEQVAPLASAALTAWHALVEFGRIRPGDLVLALGTGGVSMAALQIAKASGALFAVTSSCDEKLEQARAMGADFAVNYRTHIDWPAELLRQTGGRGADVIAETGGHHTLSQSISAAATNGKLVLIGVGAGDAPLENYGAIVAKNLIIKGITSGSRGMLVRLMRGMSVKSFAPPLDRIFPFSQVPEALTFLKEAGHVGKVAIRL